MVEQTRRSVINLFPSSRHFGKFAWGLLAYNLLVILWGAYVRATGSGAGCGGHWPTCNGEIIPTNPQTSTIIEFGHRLTSGLTLLFAVGLVLWAWQAYPRKHPIRLLSAFVMAFTLTEAIIGAGLVLFGLTTNYSPLTQALVVSIHLVNTMFLIGSNAMTAWKSSLGERPVMDGTPHRSILNLLGISIVGMIVLSVTGTITAMGDTLFPASSLSQGMQQDMSPMSDFLIRLRVIHPILAVTLAAFTVLIVFWVRKWNGDQVINNLSGTLLALLLCQLALGATNILLLAPIWLQLVHLLVADLVWIALGLFSAEIIRPKIFGFAR